MTPFRKTALAGSAMLSLASQVPAQKSEDPWRFPDFSATQVFQMKNYDVPMKVWRSGSSVRVEVAPVITALYVPGTGKVYKLTSYPDGSHQCVVMRPDQAKITPSPLELLNGTKVRRSSRGHRGSGRTSLQGGDRTRDKA